jgi:hypothetical protein
MGKRVPWPFGPGEVKGQMVHTGTGCREVACLRSAP